ncbi:MAG: HEPN domain-containing protein [Chlorobiaceae bacterium]
MGSQKDVTYRLELARGFLEEAEEECTLKRWRACVSSSTLAIENAGLAVLMLFGVSPMTHKPGRHLSQLVSEGTVPEAVVRLIGDILPELERYDSTMKMLAKYGDESELILPWALFDLKKGEAAINAARKAVRVSSEISRLVG